MNTTTDTVAYAAACPDCRVLPPLFRPITVECDGCFYVGSLADDAERLTVALRDLDWVTARWTVTGFGEAVEALAGLLDGFDPAVRGPLAQLLEKYRADRQAAVAVLTGITVCCYYCATVLPADPEACLWPDEGDSCRACDLAWDVSSARGDLARAEQDRDFIAAREALAKLAAAIEAGRGYLTGIAEQDRPADLAEEVPAAEVEHRQAAARLDAVAVLPDFDAATAAATTAVLAAVAHGANVPEWLAHVLAAAAARLGSTWALLEARPGSWEADLVGRLLAGTVGPDDEHLSDYAPSPEHTDQSETTRKDVA